MKVILKEAGKAPVVKEVVEKYRSDVKIVVKRHDIDATNDTLS